MPIDQILRGRVPYTQPMQWIGYGKGAELWYSVYEMLILYSAESWQGPCSPAKVASRCCLGVVMQCITG